MVERPQSDARTTYHDRRDQGGILNPVKFPTEAVDFKPRYGHGRRTLQQPRERQMYSRFGKLSMLTVVWLERLHVPPFAEALTRNPATTPNVVGFVSTGTTMGLGGVRPSMSLGHLPGAIGVAETCTCTETNTTARRVSQGKLETGDLLARMKSPTVRVRMVASTLGPDLKDSFV